MATKKIVFNTATLPTLSLAMIVKDESENLKRLLPLVKGMIDEIIVVDTGSTDDSREVAKSFGANVYEFPWNGSFSDARNESLKYCTKDYILWLDADDHIERQDISKLKWFIKNNNGKAIFLGLVDKRWDRDFHSLQMRLFPNHNDLQFTGKIHEQISFSIENKGIKYATCDVSVYHLGYNSKESITAKLERNLVILLQELENDKDNFLIGINAAKTLIGLGKQKEAEPIIDHALDLIREDRSKVSTENEFIAILTKLNMLTTFARHVEIMPLLDEFKIRFEHLPMFRFTYGEACFKFKDYKNAYKYLLQLKEGKINLGLIPVDAQTVLRNMTILLLASSLNVGDFLTAEACIRKMINDPEFTVKKG